MINYLMKKSRNGIIYKTSLGLIVFLVLVYSISFIVLLKVLSEKEMKEFLNKNKILKIALPVLLISLLVLTSLVSFIHHKLSTDVNRFIGGEEVSLIFEGRVKALLDKKTNNKLGKIESVEVKLNSKWFLMSPWFTKEFYIRFFAGKDMKNCKEGQCYKNKLNQNCINHLLKDDYLEFIDNLFSGIGSYEINIYSRPVKGFVSPSSMVKQVVSLELKDIYYISQVAIKYNDGLQNVVKFEYYPLNMVKFDYYPLSRFHHVDCEILFGKEVISERV